MKLSVAFLRILPIIIVCNQATNAAVINWTNTLGGNWNDVKSWFPNQVPGTSDDAVVTNSGIYAITLNINPTINSLTLGGATGQQTLNTSTRTFTLTQPSSINANGILNLSSTLKATNLNVIGQITWQNGTINGAVTVATNGLISVSGPANHDISGAITNAGKINLTDATVLRCFGSSGGGELVNLPGGLVDFQSDGQINVVGYPSEEVLNLGTIRKSGGTNTSYIIPIFYNNGTLDVQTGFFTIYSGDGNGIFKSEPGATLNLGVNPYTVDAGGIITGTGTNLMIGNITVNGVINNLTWISGQLYGGATVPNGGTLLVSGPAQHDIFGTLTNAGTIRLTDAAPLRCYGAGNLGQLFNLPGGLVDFQGDGQIMNVGYPTEAVYNQGTIRKSGGTNSVILPVFYNSGLLDVQTGTMILYTGEGNGIFQAEAGTTLNFAAGYTVDNGGAINGAGTNLFTSGITILDGNVLTTHNVVLDGATLTGTNTLINGVLKWFSGSVDGTLTVVTNALITVSGPAVHDIHGMLTNAGTIKLTDVTPLRCFGSTGQGELFNLPGGLVDFQDDGQIMNVGYPAEAVYNQGTIRKSGGTNTSYIVPTFYNTGTLDVQTGLFVIYGGDGNGIFKSEPGATLTFGVTSYTVDAGGLITGTGTNLMNGSIVVNGVINNLTWISGQLFGNPTVSTNGTLLVRGASQHDIFGAMINAGTIRVTDAAQLRCYGGAGQGQLINLPGALVDILAEGQITSVGYPTEVVTNQGVIRKSGGTNSIIDVAFSNLGTLDVQTGTLSLTSYDLTGGRLNLGINSRTNYGKIALSGSAHLTGTYSVNLNNNYQPLNGNSFTNLSYASFSGAFTNFNLPTVDAWSTNYNSTFFVLNALNARPLFTPPATNRFTVDELTALSITNTATDAVLPPQTLTYSLLAGINGMTVNPTTGLLTWTPQQTDSPATNTVMVGVTDNGTPVLTATNTYTVVVREVNVPATLPTISTQVVNELALLTVANTATNFNIHSTITGYGLINAPSNMVISASGVITWTPAQVQSPATNLITTVVTNSNPYDLVNPSLTTTNTFTVIVKEVNVAPALPVIPNQTVNELTPLTVNNTATNFNIHSTITGYGLINPPANMVISASGVITWTPAQTQSPATNVITTVVTNNNPYDLVNPLLTATNTFTVIVKEVNVAPVLSVISTQTVNELTLLTLTNSATNSNIHSTITGYGLINPPANMAINASGVITWTPAQTQSPATNVITTVVTNGNPYDLMNPLLTATNTFTVIVKEVNVAPTLPTVSTQTVNELSPLTVINTATNANIHSVVTGYLLVNAPANMVISTGGIITWTPSQLQSPGTNLITTVVTNSNPYDLVNPLLTATNSFTVIVKEVNAAPVLPAISTQTVNELTLLTVTNTATEVNIHSTITGYALFNAPANMVISASGIITWTPSQVQSPATNVITTVVTNSNPYDLVNATLISTNTFTVIVKEVNVAPALPTVSTQTVNELTLLTVTNTATEVNIHSTITGYALFNAPANMVISASGIITWTPSQVQSPATNVITTVVTNSNPYDLVNATLISTNTFTVIVKEVNVAPALPVVTNQIVNELTLLTVTNTATNANIHSSVSGYRLVNPPASMVINATGIITWTPAANQSPSTNLITTVVTNSNPYDLVNPLLTATNTFTVIVKEVNVTPTLPVIPTQSVFALTQLTVADTATGTNAHASITYALVNPPAGVTISSGGVITWTPTIEQSPATNIITTIVTSSDSLDAINPVLKSTNTFTVVVKPVFVITSPTMVDGGAFEFSFNTVANSNYTIEYSTNLITWSSVLGFVGNGSPVSVFDPNAGSNAKGFYRVRHTP